MLHFVKELYTMQFSIEDCRKMYENNCNSLMRITEVQRNNIIVEIARCYKFLQTVGVQKYDVKFRLKPYPIPVIDIEYKRLEEDINSIITENEAIRFFYKVIYSEE